MTAVWFSDACRRPSSQSFAIGTLKQRDLGVENISTIAGFRQVAIN
jgi:hypothetical protein